MKKFVLILLVFIGFIFVCNAQEKNYKLIFNLDKDGDYVRDNSNKFETYIYNQNNEKFKIDNPKYQIVDKENNLSAYVLEFGYEYSNYSKIVLTYKSRSYKADVYFSLGYGLNTINDTTIFYVDSPIALYKDSLEFVILPNFVFPEAIDKPKPYLPKVKWVIYNNKKDYKLFFREASIEVSDITETPTYPKNIQLYNFKINIGIDSLGGRWPGLCFSMDAGRYLYYMTIQIFQLDSNNNWVDYGDKAGLYFPVTCQYAMCEPFYEDYYYLHNLEHTIPIGIRDKGRFKICIVNTDVCYEFEID